MYSKTDSGRFAHGKFILFFIFVAELVPTGGFVQHANRFLFVSTQTVIIKVEVFLSYNSVIRRFKKLRILLFPENPEIKVLDKIRDILETK